MRTITSLSNYQVTAATCFRSMLRCRLITYDSVLALAPTAATCKSVDYFYCYPVSARRAVLGVRLASAPLPVKDRHARFGITETRAEGDSTLTAPGPTPP